METLINRKVLYVSETTLKNIAYRKSYELLHAYFLSQRSNVEDRSAGIEKNWVCVDIGKNGIGPSSKQMSGGKYFATSQMFEATTPKSKPA